MSGPHRLYRRLLWLLPPAFRLLFAEQMLETVGDRSREGHRSAIAFWAREYSDLLLTFGREWTRVLAGLADGSRGSRMDSHWMGWDGMRNDVKLAVRNIARRPSFSAVVVLTLALGIGVNTAIFSVVDTVVLRPLGFPEPDRLVAITSIDTETGRERLRTSYADLLEFRAASSLSAVEGYRTGTGVLSGEDRTPKNIDLGIVTQGFFDALGVAPLLGRTFDASEHRPALAEAIVLNFEFWQSEFAGDPGVIGRTILIGQRTTTVVGVMPEGFDYPFLRPMAGWLPLEHREFDTAADPGTSAFNERDWVSLVVFGRLAPESSLDVAREELEVLSSRIAEEWPRSNANLRAGAHRLKEVEVAGVDTPLLLLLGAVAAILLIAIVNTASLMLVRGTARSAEVAVRTALGAGRRRLVRLFLTEAMIFAALGGLVGLLLAAGLLEVVTSLGLNAPRLNQVQLDGRVLAVVGLTSALSGLLFGALPAIRSSRADLRGSLKEGGRGASRGVARSRLLRAFVAVEMALSTVLVVGAGLFATSFLHTVNEDPGFSPADVLSVRISLPGRYMDDPDDAWSGSNEFFVRLLDDVRGLPGVDAAALSYTNPLEPTTTFNTRFEIPGFLERPRAEQPFTNLRTVTPDFFEAFEIPLLRGRIFEDRDGREGSGVVVINETFARLYFEGESPIGHRISGPDFWSQAGYPYPWEIIGVVGDVKSRGLTEDPAPAMYLHFAQAPMGNMRLVTRSAVTPEIMAPLLRQTVWSLDRAIPMEGLNTMEDLISDSLATPRLVTLAVGSFAFLALLLAAIGVYGVLSHTVGLRRAEMGIRQVLGADSSSILRLVVRQGLLVSIVGVATGLMAALALGRFVNAFLYGVTASHWPTLAGVCVVLTTVALLACLVPALRATRVDPAIVLRSP